MPNKRTVLIVEDSKIHVRLLHDLLKERNYDVLIAYNGFDALKLLKQKDVDIVISDVEMPDMNGFELCQQIKETQAKELPIILMTSLSAPENIMESLNCKADHYITKPYEADLLMNRIEELLSQGIKVDSEDIPLDVQFAGQKYTIYSDRQHILNMLMCTYENAVWENRQLLRTQLQLKKVNEMLEQKNKEVESLNKNLRSTIGELEKTRNDLIQSEKMASLGRLVTGFAHEINTPIGVTVTAVSALAETAKKITMLLEQDEVEEEDLEKNLQKIFPASELALSNLMRAGKLVESFLRTSVEQNTEDKKLFSLFEVIEDVIISLGSIFVGTKIVIENKCPKKLNIYGYPGIIGQIMVNFMRNSLIHGFDNGKLEGKISIAVLKKEKEIVINYKDTGMGMEKEILGRIFEPFFTTKRNQGGTGLGLYICYNLVINRLKGKLICKSKPQQGIHFKLTLPLKQTMEKES